MPKEVKIVDNHEEAEWQMLERSLQRSPEERMMWLIKQNELMSRLNPVKKKSIGYTLKRIDG